MTLLDIDARFDDYKHLFDAKFKEMQRFVVDTKTNEILNENIERFLLMLSPYLTLEASLKVLEWLLQRYEFITFCCIYV